MPDLNRFFSDLGTGVSEQGKLLQSLWQKLNTPLQPATSQDIIDQILADETTPFNLAANFIPPLAAAKRFRHLPKMLADKFGEIQDMYKLSGGDMPVYHGSRGPIGKRTDTEEFMRTVPPGTPEDDLMDLRKEYRAQNPTVPDFMTEELESPIYNKITDKINELAPRLMAMDPTGAPLDDVPDHVLEQGKEAIWAYLNKDPRVMAYNRLNAAQNKLREALAQHETPTLFQYFDPAAASEFGPYVTESIMDMSQHGYSPWDIKGKLGKKFTESELEAFIDDPNISVEQFTKMKDTESAQANLFKQRLYEQNIDKQGMILDPLQYINPKTRAQPTYAQTPTEDMIPQIMTWDPNIRRRFSQVLYDPDQAVPMEHGIDPSTLQSLTDIHRPMRTYDDYYRILEKLGHTDTSDIAGTLQDFRMTQRPSIVTRNPAMFDLPGRGVRGVETTDPLTLKQVSDYQKSQLKSPPAGEWEFMKKKLGL